MAPFAFHDDLRPRLCHACPDPHAMDVISFVSHCPTCENLVQTYIQCWRPPFTTLVSQRWSATTHVGERRNFVRGLVPMSLYTKLTTPPSGRRKPAHCHDIKTRPEGSCSPAPQCPIPHAGMAKRQHPPSPAHPPHGHQIMGTRLVALQHVTHRPTAPLPPAYHPPPPPPGQSGTQASKAPPSPIPCGTSQSWETRPPAPKTCQASITETQYRKSTSARDPAPQTAAHNPGHVRPPPPPLDQHPP